MTFQPSPGVRPFIRLVFTASPLSFMHHAIHFSCKQEAKDKVLCWSSAVFYSNAVFDKTA